METVLKDIVVYAEHLLSFWESGVLLRVRQRVLMGTAPHKAPGL